MSLEKNFRPNQLNFECCSPFPPGASPLEAAGTTGTRGGLHLLCLATEPPWLCPINTEQSCRDGARPGQWRSGCPLQRVVRHDELIINVAVGSHDQRAIVCAKRLRGQRNGFETEVIFPHLSQARDKGVVVGSRGFTRVPSNSIIFNAGNSRVSSISLLYAAPMTRIREPGKVLPRSPSARPHDPRHGGAWPC